MYQKAFLSHDITPAAPHTFFFLKGHPGDMVLIASAFIFFSFSVQTGEEINTKANDKGLVAKSALNCCSVFTNRSDGFAAAAAAVAKTVVTFVTFCASKM